MCSSCINAPNDFSNDNQVFAPESMLECIKLDKVYDWVKLKFDQNVLISIPEADLPAVQAAVSAGHSLIINNIIDVANIVSSVATIDRLDDLRACVGFQKIIPSVITIIDSVTGETLSTFTKTIQLFDNTNLCFPVDMPESAITVVALAAEAVALSSIPFEGQFTFEYSICQDIQVVLQIMAKVEVKGFCASRQGTNCRGSVPCVAGTATYPTQCNG